MPGQEIDSPALPIPAVAHFDADDPAPPLEALLDAHSDSRMARIQKPLQLGPVPQHAHVQSGTERAEDGLDRLHSQPAGVAALQERDGLPAHSGPSAQRDLSQSLSHPQHPSKPAKPLCVHRTMVNGDTYRSLTGGLPGFNAQ